MAIYRQVVSSGDSLKEEMFGKERFNDRIRTNSRLPAAKIVEAVFNELDQFAGCARKKDDITLVVLKLQDFSGNSLDWQI